MFLNADLYKKIEEIFDEKGMSGVEDYINSLPETEKQNYQQVLGLFKNDLDRAYWGRVRV